MFNNYRDMDRDIYRMFSVGAIFSSLVVDRGIVYVGSADGTLYAIQ